MKVMHQRGFQALDVAIAGYDYRRMRKNHYGRGGAFATAATYAGVGSAITYGTRNMKFTHALAVGVPVGMVANHFVSGKVEKHFNPKNRRHGTKQRGRGRRAR